jgi:tetratricopeptide (TPR) repeat protein
MKSPFAALAALFLLCPIAAAQSGAPASKPTPMSAPGLQVSTSSADSKGGANSTAEDLRVLKGEKQDAFELERIGLAAANANELDRARSFFERAWKVGELPTAAYNLACLDARKGRADAAFANLDRAVAAGFDDASSLEKDPDLAGLRGRPRWAAIVSGCAKNRAAGDAAVVKEGVFLAPKERPLAILLLLHDKQSDPYAVSNAFADVALSHRLFVAAPRGPGRSAKKRFGWGSADRAAKAIDAAIAAARKKAGDANLPVLLVGVGRGGTEAFTAAAKKAPKTFDGIGSIGGPFDPGAAPSTAGLRGARLFLGSSRDADPSETAASRRGIEALRQQGFQPSVVQWPGTSSGFPKDVPRAVKDTLDAFAGVAPAAR